MKTLITTISSLMLGLFLASAAIAQDVPARAGTLAVMESGKLPPKDVDKVDVAKKLANPLANMISAPLQYQFSRGAGLNQAGSEQSLLFQPVAPFDVGGGDMFIVRPILSAVREVSVQGANGQAYSGYGISGVTLESFYAPDTKSSWIWGIGPFAQSPSGNSGKFGSQQTGAGVAAVVLNRHGPWTYGLMGYQSWNVGGNPAFGTQNNLFGQPFVAYTTKDAWTFGANMQAQYNYDAHGTVNPLYVGVSKVEVIGGVPISFGAGPIYYVTSSMPGAPSGWGGRATMTVVFLK